MELVTLDLNYAKVSCIILGICLFVNPIASLPSPTRTPAAVACHVDQGRTATVPEYREVPTSGKSAEPFNAYLQLRAMKNVK